MPLVRFCRGAAAVLLLMGMAAPSAGVLASHQEENDVCQCRADVGLAKARYEFRDGVLHLIPVVDVSIRTRGSALAPSWSAQLHHEGTVAFTSEDVDVPGDVSFSGDRHLQSAPCGRNRFTLKGITLPAVQLAGVTQDLLGDREELEGLVRLRAQVTGCGEGADSFRQSKISVEERRGSERVRSGGWGRVRE